jgi:hypothetical protein
MNTSLRGAGFRSIGFIRPPDGRPLDWLLAVANDGRRVNGRCAIKK